MVSNDANSDCSGHSCICYGIKISLNRGYNSVQTFVGDMNGRGQRVPKSRRPWLADEEEILLACLGELVATGWKSDNGFRAGYINKLEKLRVFTSLLQT